MSSATRATELTRGWRAAEVRETIRETRRRPRSCSTSPAGRATARGQHVDLRPTAEDGYQATRSYSIASAPEDDDVALTIERLDDGEVSPYLVDEARPGDQPELRGPVGGWFVWTAADGGPLFLVAAAPASCR